MHGFEVVLALLVVAAALAPIARRLDIPVAVLHVIGGAALAAIPTLREFELDPEVTFTLFVPPMLYWASLHTSMRELKRNARPILLLAVGLVLFTMVGVAVLVHGVIPGMAWAPAFVLGAVVAPPDAAVAVAIAHRLGISRRLVTLLEGETLLNDSTAFVSYNLAVAATVTGSFSLLTGALDFGWAVVGGVMFGLLVAGGVVLLRQRIHHTEVENTISLMTPFAAFLPAEHFHASGVLAVLTAGLVLSRFAPRVVSARTRIQGSGMWAMLTFTLEGLVFVLIGLRLGSIVADQLKSFDVALVERTLIVSAAVIVLRIAWILPASYLPGVLSKHVRKRETPPPFKPVLFLAWTGLRGGDTLVMALALPLVTAAGAPLPFRSAIANIGMGVILVTLVAQGLTLRPLVRLLKLSANEPSVDDEELIARRHAAEAGHKAMLKTAERLGLDPKQLERVIASHEVRTRHDTAQDIETFRVASARIRELERETLAAERKALISLRDAGTVSDEVLRKLQTELDLEELRAVGPAEE
jgi:CPA1 family monovalent cation:H+ antiporter